MTPWIPARDSRELPWGFMPAPLLDFLNVSAKRDGKLVLDGINLAVAEGEHTAILGPNGSGKSSLLKLIEREVYPLLKAEPWHLRLLGREDWSLFELRTQLGLVSSDWMRVCTREFSALEVVLSGFFGSVGVWPYHKVTPAMERAARAALDQLEVGHLAERSTDSMSSGEARQVLIARALVHHPKALILDEPTTNLDLRRMHEIHQTLRKLARGGLTVILVTHHAADIIPEIGRVVLLKEGRIWKDGAKSEVVTSKTLSRLFGIPLQVRREDGYFDAFPERITEAAGL
jgi:iron complex transport system ATP-binding protein